LSRRAGTLGAAAGLASLFACATARGNGAFPDGLSILVPAERPHEITLATTFGLVSSSDDGHVWTWSCEAPRTSCGFLYQRGGPPRLRLLALAGGALVTSDDDACTWGVATGLVVAGSVVDAFPDPADGAHVLAIVSPSGAGGQTTYTLVASRDGGATFDATLFTAASGDTLTGIEVARADARVFYLTGTTGPTFRPEVWRSGDAGAAWTPLELGAPADASDVRLVAIDPADPDKVFLRLGTLAGEDLVVVENAGAGATTRTPLHLEGGVLRAFARLPTGALVVAGALGDTPVLYRSVDGGLGFEALPNPPRLRALAARGDVLFGAADNLQDGFALGTSSDEGSTWTPLMRFQDVRAIKECVRSACQDSCATEVSLSLWSADVCTATTPPVAPQPGGCGCRLGAGEGRILPMLVLGAAFAARVRSRRRRRRADG
jgi:hypothetical protein